MRFFILTLLPRYFESPLSEGILGKAIQKGLIEVKVINIRDFADDPHRTVDDLPYGGGGGMVLKPEPIVKAIESVKDHGRKQRVIALTPQGRLLKQEVVRELLNYEDIILVCGRYEGIDERVLEHFTDDQVSIGDYVIMGGEAAALVVIEAVSRYKEGVVGNRACVENDTFSRGLLDYPQYTRPAEFRGYRVPEVLLSGNHERIRKWRMEMSIRRTLERRPEIIRKDLLTDEEIEILKKILREREGGQNE